MGHVADRVAGCLVLLYGQQLSRIVAITRDQLVITDDVARLHLGATHIEIPDPTTTSPRSPGQAATAVAALVDGETA